MYSWSGVGAKLTSQTKICLQWKKKDAKELTGRKLYCEIESWDRNTMNGPGGLFLSLNVTIFYLIMLVFASSASYNYLHKTCKNVFTILLIWEGCWIKYDVNGTAISQYRGEEGGPEGFSDAAAPLFCTGVHHGRL